MTTSSSALSVLLVLLSAADALRLDRLALRPRTSTRHTPPRLVANDVVVISRAAPADLEPCVELT
eukprot:3873936-Prymnesium_polylepis.1